MLNYDSIWWQPHRLEYVFILDNQDNQRTTDAIPSGNVTCNIESSEIIFDHAQNHAEALLCSVFIMCTGAVIGIILIVFILKGIKKSDNEAIQDPTGIPPQQQYNSPQQGAPPQQYQQQPQYPPPPQPPQYPNQQMPPPPPPQ